METHPDLVEGMNADSEATFQLLPSLAIKVEKLEGRGQMKIINVPESFCKQLSGKSYHWCLRMQSSGWVNLNIPVKKEAVKGVAKPAEPKKNNFAVQQVKRRRRKKRKTMFNISMPIHKGAVFLERMSFDQENLLELPSSVSHPGPVLSPADCKTFEIHQEEIPSEMDSFKLKQREDEDYGEYAEEERIKIIISQDTSENFQFVEREYDGRGSEERSGYNWNGDWVNEGAWSERPFPPEHHGSGWSDSHYRWEGEDPGLWNTHSGSVQRYEQQQHQSRSTWADNGPRAGSPLRGPDLSREVGFFIETARTNVQTHSRGAPVNGNNIISEPSFMNWNQLDYSRYQTAPQGYTTPYADYHISHVDQLCSFYSSHHQNGYNTNPIQPSARPVSSSSYGGAAGWGLMHPNAFIQPGQAGVYGAGSDVYFRAGIPY